MTIARSFHVATVVLCLVIAGCTSGATPIQPIASNASASPSASIVEATPAVTAQETAVATADPTPNVETPAPATPEPSAAVGFTREYVKACDSSSSYVRAIVIVTVTNTGTAWVKIDTGQSDYTIYAKDESVLSTGSFTYAYPTYLAPGATGYLAADDIFQGAKASDVKRVETDDYFIEASDTDPIVLKTAKTTVKKEAYGSGLFVTGTITNTSSMDADSAHVGAFFMNAKGDPIGFSYTNLIDNLRGGKSKGFETLPSSCPISKTLVRKTVVLAGDDNF